MLLCYTCKTTKPKEAFHNCSTSPTGKQTTCKVCRKEQRLHYYNTRTEEQRVNELLKGREWRKKNLTHCRHSWVKAKYGISPNEYTSLKIKQNFCCAICGKSEEDNGRFLATDHCHTTGKVRGLLCKCCNLGLGQFKDDAKLLSLAVDYLRNTSEETGQGA